MDTREIVPRVEDVDEIQPKKGPAPPTNNKKAKASTAATANLNINKVVAEPIKNKNDSSPTSEENKDLEAALRTSLLAENPLNTTVPLTLPPRDTGKEHVCKTCGTTKPARQSWEVHCKSEAHLSFFLQRHNVQSIIRHQDQKYWVPIYCDFCEGYLENSLAYEAHRWTSEHVRRAREFKIIRQTAENTGTIRGWTKITHPKITLKEVSRALNNSSVRKVIQKPNHNRR